MPKNTRNSNSRPLHNIRTYTTVGDKMVAQNNPINTPELNENADKVMGVGQYARPVKRNGVTTLSSQKVGESKL